MEEWAPILLPALLGGLFGAWLAFFFALRRDKEERRRELIVAKLIEAYELLEASNPHRLVERSLLQFDLEKKLQRALEIVQLFGTPSQVQGVIEIIDKLGRTADDVDLTRLQTDLRDNLREELGLGKVSSDWRWYQAIEREKNS